MDLHLKRQLTAPPERVWQAWTSSEALSQWFAPQAFVEPRVGGAFELYFNPANHEVDSTKGCTLLTYEEPQQLSFTWKGPGPLAAIMNQEGSLTQVLVSFAPIQTGTELIIQHSGWGEGADWERARQWHQGAWEMMLSNLQKHLQADETDPCCG